MTVCFGGCEAEPEAVNDGRDRHRTLRILRLLCDLVEFVLVHFAYEAMGIRGRSAEAADNRPGSGISAGGWHGSMIPTAARVAKGRRIPRWSPCTSAAPGRLVGPAGGDADHHARQQALDASVIRTAAMLTTMHPSRTWTPRWSGRPRC